MELKHFILQGEHNPHIPLSALALWCFIIKNQNQVTTTELCAWPTPVQSWISLYKPGCLITLSLDTTHFSS